MNTTKRVQRAVGAGLAAAGVAAAIGLGAGAASAAPTEPVPVPEAPRQGPITGTPNTKDDTGLPGEPLYGDGIRPEQGTLRVTDIPVGPGGVDPSTVPLGLDRKIPLNNGPVGGWSDNTLPINPQSGKADIGIAAGDDGVLKVGFSRQYRLKATEAEPTQYIPVDTPNGPRLGVQYKYNYQYQQTTHGDIGGVPFGDLDPDKWRSASPDEVNALRDKGVPIPSLR